MSFDLIAESRKIIGIRSISSEGTRELVAYLAPFCSRLGLHLILQGAPDSASGSEVNLIAHTIARGSPDLCPAGLLLDTHLDTVPPGDLSLWTETGGDPFNGVERDGRIYGLGSADTKLDFLCKLQALERVGVKNFKTPVALVGTYGEERALAGVRRLRESGIVHPRFVLVGEPSELNPITAHKGILYMRAWGEFPDPCAGGGSVGRDFQGRAAHGATPELGENAILKAFRWLDEEGRRVPGLHLTDLRGGTVHNVVPDRCRVETVVGQGDCPRVGFIRKFLGLLRASERYLETCENRLFDPPRTVWNVGVVRLEGGRLEIEFDYRLIPETDGNELYEIFQALPSEVPGAHLEVIRSNPPMMTPHDSELARRVGEALAEVQLPVSFQAKSGNTEGAIFQQMGAEAIVIGPGKSYGNIHAPNEYNEIAQLEKAVDLYASFLRKFC